MNAADSHRTGRRGRRSFLIRTVPLLSAVMMWGAAVLPAFAAEPSKAEVPAAAAATAADARAARAGRVRILKGFKLLQLYGRSPKENGFAHGRLLAREIVAACAAAITSLPNFSASAFEKVLTPFALHRLKWDATAREELAGLYEGLCSKLKERERCLPGLNRPLKLSDLYALNAVGDLFGPNCSGFSAWGKRTADGETLYARTLDFPLGPKGVALQILVARMPPPAGQAAKAKHRPRRPLALVAVGWPGMIGAYTGMNEAGLAACLHDAGNYSPGGKTTGLRPRGLALRAVLERLDPEREEPGAALKRLLDKTPASCGNLFHAAWPNAAAKKWKRPPSVVAEWDSFNHPRDGYATLRRPRAGEQTLILTNHMRVRRPPIPCRRYAAIKAALARPAAKKLTPETMRRGLIAAEQFVAAHSVVFEPAARRLHLSFTKDNVLSTRVKPTTFTFKELTTVPENPDK